MLITSRILFFFLNDPAPTEFYTLPLHDALPIWLREQRALVGEMLFGAHQADRRRPAGGARAFGRFGTGQACADDDQSVSRHAVRTLEVRLRDRKSTRLNSSHLVISYAVFCLKKK